MNILRNNKRGIRILKGFFFLLTFNFILFTLHSTADAGAARVQMKHVYPGAAATFDNPVTEGNLIVVFASGSADPSGTTTISDTLGNTYTKIGTTTASVAGSSRIVAWYSWNVLGGANTITTTNVANTDVGITIIEYSGIRIDIDPLDTYATSADSTADPIVAPLTTAAKDLIVYGWNNENANRYVGPAAGFTQVNYDSGHYDATGEMMNAPIGAYSPGIDVSSADNRSVIVAAAFKVARQSLQKPPNNLGLVGYWSMEDGSGTQVTDNSGNGNNGTFTNMESDDWVNGKRGKALRFTGGDERVNIGNVDSANQNITISAWVKADAGTQGYVISKNADAGGVVPYSLNVGGNASAPALDGFGFYDGGTWRNSGIGTDIRGDGLWHHVTGVFDGTNLMYYLDGVLNASTTEGSGWTRLTHSEDATIGTYIQDGGYMSGLIDEVRIYNRALTAAEIAALYGTGIKRINATAAGRGPQTGLVGHWTFDGQHLNLTTSTDSSGQGNHGTLAGATGAQNKPQPTLGRLGQALNFDGTDDGVNIPYGSSVNLTGDLTISSWIKATTFVDNGGNGMRIVSHWEPAQQYLTAILPSGALRFAARGSGYTNGGLVDSSGGIATSTWYHFTSVKSGTVLYIYINGVLNSSQDIGITTLNSSTDNVAIGMENTNGSFSFDGFIDDVRIYNRALSATEIKQLYNMSK